MKKFLLILSLASSLFFVPSFSVLAAPRSLSVFKTKNLSFQSKNNFKIRYSSLKSKTPVVSNPQMEAKDSGNTPVIPKNANPVSANPQESNLAKTGPMFSIPKLGLNNQELALASVTNLIDLDQKMLYKPILDTLTFQPCLENSSTYIMGHSEPVDRATSMKPAVRIFQDLDQLAVGDSIEMKNQAGTECKYQVIGTQIVTTALNGAVSQETFNNLYFPQVKNNSILKIQTCVKGSATKRLILTAIKV